MIFSLISSLKLSEYICKVREFENKNCSRVLMGILGFKMRLLIFVGYTIFSVSKTIANILSEVEKLNQFFRDMIRAVSEAS